MNVPATTRRPVPTTDRVTWYGGAVVVRDEPVFGPGANAISPGARTTQATSRREPARNLKGDRHDDRETPSPHRS